MTNITLPYTFTNGTIADATQVNADLVALQTGLNANTRTILTGPTTFYVSTTGSDTVTGLDPSHPAATVNYIYNLLQSQYDCNDQTVTIQLAAGTYNQIWLMGITQGVNHPASLIIQGSIGNPASVTIVGGSSDAIHIENIARCAVQGMAVTTTGGRGVMIWRSAHVNINSMNWGACAGGHLYVGLGSSCRLSGAQNVTGNAPAHWTVESGGMLAVADYAATPYTITGTPAFTQFCLCQSVGYVELGILFPLTFSGTITGNRILVQRNANIYSAATLPGTIMTNANCPTGGRYQGPEGNFPTAFQP